MILSAHDMPPTWVFVLVAVAGAASAYYWTLQLLKFL